MSNLNITMHQITKIEITNHERNGVAWQELVATDDNNDSSRIIFFTLDNTPILPETLPFTLQGQAA